LHRQLAKVYSEICKRSANCFGVKCVCLNSMIVSLKIPASAVVYRR
jgi:hypothetical protein